ncbi:HNH endonuclease signature motif containing protein [Corynebacterium glyciniphilum]|uniref:HNH endonuclease signature motif containing protein n=1 Tax=Corynebacterium glyciniphilum TaxID=1404244 RepID=UPI002656FB69|nr:HNH endonuclease signature motif containing protein [Corynebacterium glyciniphilum]MDN6705510.1 HNH endonuclease [Corynebacterium glyciniphilum]
MTSTRTTEPTTGETYTALAARYASAVNTAELDLVAFLSTIPVDARHSTALAIRRRTPAEAHRYTHAADLAERMPDLFHSFRTDGRYSLDHLDAIWAKVNRHARALTAAGTEVPANLDAAVALGIAGWIRATGITALTALADVADEVLCTLAPLAVADTEAREAAAVSLTRSGTRLTLDCGSRYTAEALWSAISAAALEVRREIVQDDREGPSAPSMAHCRGQVALWLLGGHREQLKVTLNAYRARPEAPAYVLGCGWVSPATAAQLAALADKVRELPEAGQIPESPAYRFPAVHKAAIQGRDAHCRFPGCTVPADACEHDHLVNSPHTDPGSDGPTSVTNGICLCRTHHTLKTAGIWRPVSQDDAVTINWSGPGGVRVTTTAAGPLSPVRDPA